jgi:hypothetical protein
MGIIKWVKKKKEEKIDEKVNDIFDGMDEADAKRSFWISIFGRKRAREIFE